ncbi:D-fructose 1,6-bisphosphatase [Sulfolobus sp. S-194]|uniref:inositol monophosphatase family protein n=1 Tax=Sulfolobus sp. S-194 TaxID=2512240 RepID=UPI001436E16C|nr:inositol monophosphatase family protein [Sulfolobus sp. S-194]QIW23413.1 D-fructose 1,6-bisphosphatase [Sulfolobus sp. S-194]
MREVLIKITKEIISFLYEEKDKQGIDKIIGKHGNDVTRVIDKKSEELIFDRLNHSGYKFMFVSEESGVVNKENYEYIAIIDPLDGSTNYLNGIPWSSVSIAVYKKGEKDILSSFTGVVGNIFTKKIYSYDENFSYVDDERITTLNPPDKLLIIAYFSRSRLLSVKNFLDSLNVDYKIRSLGSASLDMILVCTGKASIYFDIRGKLRNVDVAASSNFCKKLEIIPRNSRLEEIRVGIEKVEQIQEIILSSDQNLLSSLALSLQKA